ncbi:1,4-dihydroxy-2-naphthoyl-CoA synthase [Demequina sp.]|uniref:1,4-dihydroxy-2-naphthoyl-CoA synthase n=1 Tax=Demequina sp. TaxID=2050685 RepID=UPI0025BE9D7F|nr:1,4-dihydroxy-2-naphthoyl-CoA synthase [Demequina sp.]
MSDIPAQVSDLMDPTQWRSIDGFADEDVTYHRWVERDGTMERDLPAVRIAFNRPEVRNAFRPQTVDQLYRALDHARMTAAVGTVILTGNGPAPDGVHAFCSGGDQRIRGRDGYLYEGTAAHAPAHGGRLHILEVQRLMRTSPKVIVAAVNGWAAGGGHSLHVVADLSIASREHARFKQTDANVGSFDAGYGSALLARQVGDKRAREIFFLAREYSADDAERWGAVNEAVPHAELEDRALDYARIVATKSPQAIRMLKFAFNLADDGLAGQQVFAGEATRMAYMTDEAQEGRDAFLERRDPDWEQFPYAF